MDTSLLAQSLAAALAPARKSLMALGVLSGVPAKTRALWSRLRPLVESRPPARAAAEDLAERSEARPAREAFAKHLKEILEADSGLASEMAELLGTDRPRGTTRSRPGQRDGIFEVAREQRSYLDPILPDQNPDISPGPKGDREESARSQQGLGDRTFEVTRERWLDDLDPGTGVGGGPKSGFDVEDDAWLEPTPDLRLPAAAAPPSLAPEPATDVRFTTYTPAAVRPETWATLLAYCHLPEAVEAVETDRKSRLGGSPLRSEGAGLQKIARGA